MTRKSSEKDARISGYRDAIALVVGFCRYRAVKAPAWEKMTLENLAAVLESETESLISRYKLKRNH